MPEGTEDKYYQFPLDRDVYEFALHFRQLDYLAARRVAWKRFAPRLARFLYKYASFRPDDSISIDRARDVIVRSRFWLSAPGDFNDPFDCKAHCIAEAPASEKRKKLEQLSRSYQPEFGWLARKKHIDRLMANPSLMTQSTTKALTDTAKSLGVTCFAEDPRNILMWPHYAASHTGICYQFEPMRDFETFAQAVPVKYTETYPIVNFFDEHTRQDLREVLSKASAWSYERERRIIALGGANHWLRFPAAALTGIVLGIRFPDMAKERLKRLLADRSDNGQPPIRLYKAKQHPTAYKLQIKAVSHL